jgi:hypothetical protein
MRNLGPVKVSHKKMLVKAEDMKMLREENLVE